MFQLTINTGNAAFGDDAMDRALELERILKKIALQLKDGEQGRSVFDSNGNKVGEWSVTDV